MDYGVGDKVVCIDATHTNKLVDGGIYTVTKIEGNGVLVKETTPTHPYTGFRIERFRKVRPNPMQKLAQEIKDSLKKKDKSKTKIKETKKEKK